jgi:ADP-ribose pyrophosphatase YjhB (NUDIX family)
MLEAFLDGRSPLASERALWGDLELEIEYYATDECPPEHLVTSVRAVVLAPSRVLVIREPTGAEHIIPGGRRNAGEPLEDTVRREVLEETCWTVTDLSILAVLHFHVRGPAPEGYPYPHPDFLQLVYLTSPHELQTARVIEDDWVDACEFVPIDSVRQRGIPEPQQLLLVNALRRLRT